MLFYDSSTCLSRKDPIKLPLKMFQQYFQTPEQEQSPGLQNVSSVATMLPNVLSNASLTTPDDVEPDSLAASTPGILFLY
jgi:hypothetical protein